METDDSGPRRERPRAEEVPSPRKEGKTKRLRGFVGVATEMGLVRE